jgi:hypothetical protein
MVTSTNRFMTSRNRSAFPGRCWRGWPPNTASHCEGPHDYKRNGVIDRDWLLEQYVGRRRTLSDLAREKSMSTATMTRWAHLHQIPLRPRGGAIHDSFLRTID